MAACAPLPSTQYYLCLWQSFRGDFWEKLTINQNKIGDKYKASERLTFSYLASNLN